MRSQYEPHRQLGQANLLVLTYTPSKNTRLGILDRRFHAPKCPCKASLDI